MINKIKEMSKFEKAFQRDKNNKFKRLRFRLEGEEINLVGKTLDNLTNKELVYLKKYSKKFIDDTFEQL